MPETNDSTHSVPTETTAREKFEQEKLSRRAALRKIGMTTGMALFGMFAVDDLARVAIKKMEAQKATREIGETVAKEFKDSGVVFADAANEPTYYSAASARVGTAFGQACKANPGVTADGTPQNCTNCVRARCLHSYSYFGWIPTVEYQDCYDHGSTACGGAP